MSARERAHRVVIVGGGFAVDTAESRTARCAAVPGMWMVIGAALAMTAAE